MTITDEAREAQRLAQKEQQRQKQLRRKNYHDLQVQGTNNSLIVSKRLVEQLYTPHVEPQLGEWFKYFVPKAKRRSPAINRGYWIRMEAIKRTVVNVLRLYPGKRVAVVNLGCGFDPLPFQLFSLGIDVECYDIDYPDLIANKQAMIDAAEPVQQVIKDRKYHLVGCDMNHADSYEKVVKQIDADVAIFIAEVLLAYMKPDDADAVIALLATHPNPHFVILEQMMPLGPDTVFAKKMMHHFDHLRHPLQLIERYHTRDLQQQRFSRWFSLVELKDLYEVWRDYIDDETKAKVAEVEPFDEWEEFILFCHHYLVTHACNDGHLYLGERPPAPAPLALEHCHWEKLDPLELKFPAACALSLGVLVHGGLGQTRSDATLIDGKLVAPSDPQPLARMNHTVVALPGLDRALLIGGRGRPGLDYDDVWLFDNGAWRQLPALPFSLSRHAAAAISASEVLVVSTHGIQVYDINTHTANIINGDICLASAGIAVDSSGQYAYIVGGMSDRLAPTTSDAIYRVDIVLGAATVISRDPHYARIGALVACHGATLVIAGGINPLALTADVLYVDVTSLSVTATSIPGLVLIGHHLVTTNGAMAIVGGGAVCYSFGNVYNPSYTMPLSHLA